jgi:hypothetical protein
MATDAFAENFEAGGAWTIDPSSSDTATRGAWQIGKPKPTNAGGPKQLKSYGGSGALVTGRKAGTSADKFDVDGGVTTAVSMPIALDASFESVTLSFYAYMAHDNKATKADYFQVRINGMPVFTELGSKSNDNAVWMPFTIDLSPFRGETIQVEFACADLGKASLVECGVDALKITGLKQE